MMSPSSGEARRDGKLGLLHAAHMAWIIACVDLIRTGFSGGEKFTTDALWRMMTPPPERRAMGAAIVKAQRLGLIEHSGSYRKSARPECNARPMAVWIRR